MAITLNNIVNENRIITDRLGNFSVVEDERDASVSIANAQTEYFMSKMNVRRRQVLIELKNTSAVVQAGAMQ